MTFRPFTNTSISPSSDDTFSLGTPTHRWKDGYFGPDSVHIFAYPSETDGYNGADWSIQITSDGYLEFAANGQTNAELSTSGLLSPAAGIRFPDNSVMYTAATDTLPAGSAGAIQFNDNSAFGADTDNLFWDKSGQRLGIKTNTPGYELHVVGDALITGNFTVQGTTTSVSSETMLVSDNHVYLNNGYSAVSAQTGGLVVNYLPTSTSTTVNGVYVAGVLSTSNPTVITTGAATFAASSIIQIAGSAYNDGLYEVLSHAANILTIRGVGVTATVEDFTGNQFVAGDSDGATITQVNVSVLRAGVDGVWETGTGSSTPVAFSNLGTGTFLGARRTGPGATDFAFAGNGDEDTGIVYDAWNLGPDSLSVYAGGSPVAYFTTNRMISGGSGGANLFMGTGSAANPQFSGTGDSGTGFFASGGAGVTTSGVSRQFWTDTQTILGLPLRGTDGTAAAPAVSFSSDDNTGLYLSAPDTLSVSTGGSERLNVSTSLITVLAGMTLATAGTGNINLPNNVNARFQIDGYSVGATVTAASLDTLTDGSNADALHTHAVSSVALADGTAAVPSLYFASDTNTGIYRAGADTIGIATNGVSRWTTSASQHTSTLSIIMDVGTGGGSGLVRSGTGDAFTWESGGPSLRAASNNKLTATATAIETTVPVRASDGAVGAPAISFVSDTNSGHWLVAPDTLATSTGGVERVRMSTTEAVFNDPGNNYDFRVEGDTDANLFFADASADAVGFGTSAPNEKATVSGRLSLQETTSPSSTSGFGKVWAATASDVYGSRLLFMGDSGSVSQLIQMSGHLDAITPTTGAIALDFSPDLPWNRLLQLTGDPTFSTSSLAAGRSMTVFVNAGGADRALSFPGGWSWISGTPTQLTTNNWGVLSLFATDGYDSGLIAAWSAEGTPLVTRAPISTKTSNYTMTSNDDTVLVDASSGAITISLPAAASSNEYVFNIKKIDSTANTVTVDADAAETIDGSATYVMSTQHQSVTIHCDGSAWWIK